MQKVSVIICTLNEGLRIKDCLDALTRAHSGEIILVDGGSTDHTLQIAASYQQVTVIRSNAGSLTKDRSVGVASASHDLICFIDADHIVDIDTISCLKNELLGESYSALQAQLRAPRTSSILCKGEDQWWKRYHNNPGQRAMIGVAPTMYKAHFFNELPFSDHITKTIDDTDLFYRAELHGNMPVGVASTAVVFQSHKPSLREYLKKFWWYGAGDGEFMFKYPERIFCHSYHLAFRYPAIYSTTHLCNGEIAGASFTFLQGITRTTAALYTMGRLILASLRK